MILDRVKKRDKCGTRFQEGDRLDFAGLRDFPSGSNSVGDASFAWLLGIAMMAIPRLALPDGGQVPAVELALTQAPPGSFKTPPGILAKDSVGSIVMFPRGLRATAVVSHGL
jgi:hypothetical protein